MAKNAAYLHVYCYGPWESVVTEIVGAVYDSALNDQIGPLRIGVIGTLDDQVRCIQLVRRFWMEVEVVAAEPFGWEQVTLAALHQGAQYADWDHALYVHTKGVSNPSAWNDAWRRSMIEAVIRNWRYCIKTLDVLGVDAVGCHWLTPDMDLPFPVDRPYFGGNMWWATSNYLASLPEPSNAGRHEAEAWLGTNDPDTADLCQPGWPSYATLYQRGID